MNYNFAPSHSPILDNPLRISTGRYYASRVVFPEGNIIPISSNKPLLQSHHSLRVTRIIRRPLVVVQIAHYYTLVGRESMMSHYWWSVNANVFDWVTMSRPRPEIGAPSHSDIEVVVFEDDFDFQFSDEFAVPFGELFGDRLVI